MSCAGKYIVIEGNDGTGKSTQVAKLAEYFRSIGRTVGVNCGGKKFSLRWGVGKLF